LVFLVCKQTIWPPWHEKSFLCFLMLSFCQQGGGGWCKISRCFKFQTWTEIWVAACWKKLNFKVYSNVNMTNLKYVY
jgi:hypothetical protein